MELDKDEESESRGQREIEWRGTRRSDSEKVNQRDCWIDGQRHRVLIKKHSKIQMD